MPSAFTKSLIALPCALVLLVGCSTPIKPAKQSLTIETVVGNQPLAGVQCQVSNDLGQWTVVTPGNVEVIPSEQDLSIACASADNGNGLARAVARPTAGYLNHPVVNLTMPVVAVVEPIKQVTVGLTRVYPQRIQVMMDQDIIVTATQ